MSQYTRNAPLTEADLTDDPLPLFETWLAHAGEAGVHEPTAMTLATVGEAGRPSARVVLFKGLHEAGLTFYTNYESRKGCELLQRPEAAAVFWWDRIERSVRFEGRVSRVPRALSEHYFHSRPRGSQLGAWVSAQSRPVSGREELERRLEEATRRFDGGEVPLPEQWGGYALVPERVEFWQGRRDRLHDRFRYTREAAGWRRERLQP